jgi:hypothetical protein
MASMTSGKLVNVPRLRRRSVSSLNQRSTRLSQELDVGVKCRCQRARRGWASQSRISGALWADRLSRTTWMSCRSEHPGAEHDVGWRCVAVHTEEEEGVDRVEGIADLASRQVVEKCLLLLRVAKRRRRELVDPSNLHQLVECGWDPVFLGSLPTSTFQTIDSPLDLHKA